MAGPESQREAAEQLAAVATGLAAALADEESAPLAPVVLLDQACGLLDRLSWAICREPVSVPVGGLAEIARALAAELLADGKTAPPGGAALDPHALAVGTQAGDFAVAYHAWAARGHRTGAARDLVESETAHLLLTTAIFAELAGIDIDKAIGRLLSLAPGPADRAPRAEPAQLPIAQATAGSRA